MARQLAGFDNQAEFASLLGLTAATYGRYERSETEPSLLTLVKTRKLTGVSLDRLLPDPENPLAGKPLDRVAMQQNTPKSRH